MKIMTWNVRGLGRLVKKVVEKNKPDILVLQETKVETVDRSLLSTIWVSRFKGWVCLPSIGRKGGVETELRQILVFIWAKILALDKLHRDDVENLKGAAQKMIDALALAAAFTASLESNFASCHALIRTGRWGSSLFPLSDGSASGSTVDGTRPRPRCGIISS
ncbi:hypothetical protein Sjap_001907 [Stephania japonica]|uniref:Endonuclease/exonuclease/phosphatase domain-containing protein n=1 Tax=Stephania japonica TaxID=461633 RepID=A0AAP0KN53_9MAGN